MKNDKILKTSTEMLKRVVPCIVIELFIRLFMVIEYGQYIPDSAHLIAYIIICILVNMYISKKKESKYWKEHFIQYADQMDDMFEQLWADLNNEIEKVENEMKVQNNEQGEM